MGELLRIRSRLSLSAINIVITSSPPPCDSDLVEQMKWRQSHVSQKSGVVENVYIFFSIFQGLETIAINTDKNDF